MFCYGIFSGLCGRLSKVKAKVEFGCANARKEPLFFQVKPLNVLFLYIFCSIIWFCCSPLQNVRRVALVTFNSAAHNKPSLIRDLLEQILPQLYNETKVRVCRFKIFFFFFFHQKAQGLLLRDCACTIADQGHKGTNGTHDDKRRGILKLVITAYSFLVFRSPGASSLETYLYHWFTMPGI